MLNRQAAIGFREENAAASQGDYERLQGQVMDELKKTFRPELLNRIDKIVVFHPLNHAAIRKIVDLQLSQLSDRLEKQKISLEVSNPARELIASQGFDPESGARPVRRVIQNTIEDQLAEAILRGEFSKGAKVQVDKRGSKLVLSGGKIKATTK
jgi:ATP-dependent Clp protease ATP-binding subunit ClpA